MSSGIHKFIQLVKKVYPSLFLLALIASTFLGSSKRVGLVFLVLSFFYVFYVWSYSGANDLKIGKFNWLIFSLIVCFSILIPPLSSNDLYFYSGLGRFAMSGLQEVYFQTIEMVKNKDPILNSSLLNHTGVVAQYGPLAISIFRLPWILGAAKIESAATILKILMSIFFICGMVASLKMFPIRVTRKIFVLNLFNPFLIRVLLVDGHKELVAIPIYLLSIGFLLRHQWFVFSGLFACVTLVSIAYLPAQLLGLFAIYYSFRSNSSLLKRFVLSSIVYLAIVTTVLVFYSGADIRGAIGASSEARAVSGLIWPIIVKLLKIFAPDIAMQHHTHYIIHLCASFLFCFGLLLLAYRIRTSKIPTPVGINALFAFAASYFIQWFLFWYFQEYYLSNILLLVIYLIAVRGNNKEFLLSALLGICFQLYQLNTKILVIFVGVITLLYGIYRRNWKQLGQIIKKDSFYKPSKS